MLSCALALLAAHPLAPRALAAPADAAAVRTIQSTPDTPVVVTPSDDAGLLPDNPTTRRRSSPWSPHAPATPQLRPTPSAIALDALTHWSRQVAAELAPWFAADFLGAFDQFTIIPPLEVRLAGPVNAPRADLLPGVEARFAIEHLLSAPPLCAAHPA